MKSAQLIPCSLGASIGTPVPQTFAAWFGDSKVVDSSGAPLVVFHGTLSQAFDEFDISPENAYEGGAFFSTSRAVASHFADPDRTGNDPEEEGYAPHVLPVYLSIKNPKRLRADDVMRQGSHSFDAMRQAMRAARQAGHDGAHIIGAAEADEGAGDNVADQWVAFFPEQVKSAIGNPYQLDVERADITGRHGWDAPIMRARMRA